MESARNPLALLPEECWERILAWIEDPADLLNCSRTCQLWNDILDSRKTVWLFPSVFPHLFSYLENNDLLNCRQVSKSWKLILDRHLEEGQFQLMDPTPDDLNFWNAVRLDLSMSEDPKDQVERFQLEVGDSTRNRIPSRAVSLRHGADYALDFLKKFGVHVWHLTINSDQDNLMSPIDFITIIREYLVCTPNLRTLILTDGNFSELLEYLEDDGVFHQFYAEYPLPPLPHLNTLLLCLFQRVTEESASFEQQLVSSYAPNLERFQLWQHDHLLVPRSAPNLTHLDSGICSAVHLHAIRNLDSPLKILTLAVNNGNSASAVDLFRTAERFAGTLTTLTLEFDWENQEVIAFPVEIHLPRLESLRLTYLRATSDTSFDFLESISKLRWLEIQFWEYDKMEGGDPRGERVVINEHLGRNGAPSDCGMYLSNIWTILPRLHRMRFLKEADRYGITRTKTFSRDWYEYLHDKLQRMNII